MTSEQVQINLSEIKPIETTAVDLNKHDRREVEIEKAEVLKVPSKYNKVGYQWVLKVSSKPVESLGEGEDLIEFRASELFNLIQDDEGNLKGYPTGESSNLMQFMKDIKAQTKHDNLQGVITELLGKKALIKAYDKEVDGNKKVYLKFRY